MILVLAIAVVQTIVNLSYDFIYNGAGGGYADNTSLVGTIVILFLITTGALLIGIWATNRKHSKLGMAIVSTISYGGLMVVVATVLIAIGLGNSGTPGSWFVEIPSIFSLSYILAYILYKK